MSRYRIGTVFARGAQALLYSASDLLNGKECILKTGNGVHEEAILALELNHPYIAKPFDVGIDPAIGAYTAYNAFSDPSLLQWKPNRKDGLRRVAAQVCDFLAFLHHRGWLYHDFKPEHFLISDHEIRVLDLGLCKPIKEISSTFSGTFPFIAPEKLSGRHCDIRSDIFAFGMMLLSVLLPREKWDYEPSLSLLQELPKRAHDLAPFWCDLISEMTAQEPSQRCETAEVVWKRLLPATSRRRLLFFPVRNHLPSVEKMFEQNQIFILRSSSLINLREVENQVQLTAWKRNLRTIAFDFREKGLENCLDDLHRHLFRHPSSDFLTCVNDLRAFTNETEFLLIFRGTERLSSQKRALFLYAISELKQSKFKILVTTTRVLSDLSEDSCRQIEIPLMRQGDTEEVLSLIFPASETRRRKIERFAQGSYSIPEQLVSEIRKNLAGLDFSFWPAGAKESFVPTTISGLTSQEQAILACFAVSGVAMSSQALSVSLDISQDTCIELLESLQKRGFVELQQNEFFLMVSEKIVFNGIKSSQISRIAKKILLSPASVKDPQIRYRLANFAKQERLSAILALGIARIAIREQRRENAYEWFWNAFANHATLPKSLLFRLARFCLLRARMKETRQLLRHIRARFGLSYRLYDLVLDLYHREFRLQKAESIARSVANRAKRRNHPNAFDYFSILVAMFLIKQNRYEEAEAILAGLACRRKSGDRTTRIDAMFHHYLGLLHCYRGQFADSIRETLISYRSRYPIRNLSTLNLGIYLEKTGGVAEAKRFLHEAIQTLTARKDTANVANAYNSLGIFLKQRGLLDDAKEAYYACLQLSLVNRNYHQMFTSRSNLGILYQSLGRTTEAIGCFRRAAKTAKKLRLDGYYAAVLNHIGHEYAIQGRIQSAISCLLKSLKILQLLDLKYYLAYTHEYLGLSYLFSRDFQKAQDNLNAAKNMISGSGACLDSKRVSLFLAILYGEKNDLASMLRLIQSNNVSDEYSFERGLYFYALAFWHLRSNPSSQSECREALHEAQRIFHTLPSLFWLGKLYRLKAEYYLETDHYEKASLSLQSAYNVFSRLGAKKELKDLKRGIMKMKSSEELIHRMAEKLPYKILLMIKDVLAERDPNRMIEEILQTTLQFTDMQRAVLILDEKPPRIFKSASLEENAVQEIREISHSAMNSAIETRKSFVCLDVTADSALRSKPSIIENRIMSVLCFPLRAEDQLLGVLYLDSREGVETVSQSETSLLEIFASIISVVLLNLLALEHSIRENKQLRSSIAANQQFPEIIGNSEEIHEVRNKIYRLLNHELPVLIVGETGTGKELVARVLHSWSKRKDAPFVAINCSAINRFLLESELFGHEKGSFTGAHQMKRGLFEEAGKGTIFLDEIGDMPFSMQAKLLRVLQEGEFRRMGGNGVHHTNARVVLATNQNLLDMVKSGKFREDLYYRICGVQIQLPPLRKRSRDIPLLARQFLKNTLINGERQVHGFTPQAQELMVRYSWPGNVRQLRNEIERIAALSEKEWIGPEDFSPEIHESLRHRRASSETSESTLKEIEKEIVQKRLEEHGWNILRTASSLGLTRHGLYSKMRLYGIENKRTSPGKGQARSNTPSSGSSIRKRRA